MLLRLFVFSILICSLSGISGIAQTINLDSLLIKSIGGPEAFEQLRSLRSARFTGSVNFNGMPGRFEILFQPPNKYYQLLDLGQFVQTAGYDGTIAWQRDHNGRVSEMTGLEKKSLMNDIYIQSYAYLLQDQVADVMRYKGEIVYNDSNYHEIVLKPEGLDSSRILLHSESGLMRYIFRQMTGIDVIIDFSDYENIKGLLFSKTTTTTALQAPISIKMIADSIVLNTAIDQSLFDFPDSSRVDFHFPDNLSQFELPIVFDGSHIWIEATLNGKLKAWFILDSGASANVMHTPLVDKLKLPAAGAIPTQGVAGFETVKLVQCDSLNIGAVTLYSQVAATYDLSAFSSSTPANGRFGGILGQDFLSRFPLLINYQDQLMTIYNPKQFILPEFGTTVSFRLTSLVPTVTASIGDVSGDFVVDLGNPYDLIIHSSFSSANGIARMIDNLQTMPGSLGGIGGAVKAKTGTTTAFVIGAMRVPHCTVTLPGESGGISGSDQLAGNIGNGILKNYNVLFDYGNGRLTLYDR